VFVQSFGFHKHIYEADSVDEFLKKWSDYYIFKHQKVVGVLIMHHAFKHLENFSHVEH
jgi:hypothetical protein